MPAHNHTGRSKKKLGNFVPLEHYLLDSPAWKSLPPSTRAVYVVVARRYNGFNNGRLSMSGRMVTEEVPISRQTATRALRELCEKGFLDLVKFSGFNMKSREGRAAEYRLNIARCDATSQIPSKAFLRWKPNFHLTASPESQPGLTKMPG